MARPDALRVVVIGGYGYFGHRLVQRLTRQDGLHIIVAGRSLQQAQAVVATLRDGARSPLEAAALDTSAADFAAQLRHLAPHAAVHASGPFQGQTYHVAQACIDIGAHCIDLADARAYVAGIGGLHTAACAAGVAVISGASSVPALSSAAADRLAVGFSAVHRIDIGISPGNRTDRGLSTVQAILSYCGQPIPGNLSRPAFGWSGGWRHVYPAPVGTRRLSPCDVPDLVLLPQRYPGAPVVRFGAGLELPFLQFGMHVMALLARGGWVRDWSAHAQKLKRMADWFKGWGTDHGAMHVAVTGILANATQHTRTWHLLATDGDGPYVPTLAAAALIRQLREAGTLPMGAVPCIGLLSLDAFVREAEGLRIHMAEATA